MATNTQSSSSLSAESSPTDMVDSELVSALRQVVDGLANADNHYSVSSNYYDHQTIGREGERWYIAQIWLNADTTSNVQLTDVGLVCDVWLNRRDSSQVSRILLPYDQIWWVQTLQGNPLNLYHRTDKMNLKRPGDED